MEKNCEKRKVFSLALKDDRVEQCLSSCESEFQMWDPKQEKREGAEAMSLAFALSDINTITQLRTLAAAGSEREADRLKTLAAAGSE